MEEGLVRDGSKKKHPLHFRGRLTMYFTGRSLYLGLTFDAISISLSKAVDNDDGYDSNACNCTTYGGANNGLFTGHQ
jgi:hypothetical protein